jgi:hypothetical protein
VVRLEAFGRQKPLAQTANSRRRLPIPSEGHAHHNPRDGQEFSGSHSGRCQRHPIQHEGNARVAQLQVGIKKKRSDTNELGV